VKAPLAGRCGVNAGRLPVLYHFTCRCSDRRILSGGGWVRPLFTWPRLDAELRKEGFPATGLHRAPGVVWLTDMTEPDRATLGLTSTFIACDRTEVRYRVRAPEAESWTTWALRHDAALAYLELLTAGGGDPDRWYVSTAPVFVLARRFTPTPVAEAQAQTTLDLSAR
jgi:hypothetical protein